MAQGGWSLCASLLADVRRLSALCTTRARSAPPRSPRDLTRQAGLSGRGSPCRTTCDRADLKPSRRRRCPTEQVPLCPARSWWRSPFRPLAQACLGSQPTHEAVATKRPTGSARFAATDKRAARFRLRSGPQRAGGNSFCAGGYSSGAAGCSCWALMRDASDQRIYFEPLDGCAEGEFSRGTAEGAVFRKCDSSRLRPAIAHLPIQTPHRCG